jgi:Tfp pilus assembly protein PilV
MVEMLMAAFIMAIGLLGLAMLQTMSLRSTTGSRSATTAVRVAERVLFQAEALGRNSLLNSRTGNTVTAPNPNYFGAANFTQYYNFDGTFNATNSFFTVTVAPSDLVTSVTGVGGLKLITVTVQWTEAVTAGNVPISRQVVLSRRIAYASS